MPKAIRDANEIKNAINELNLGELDDKELRAVAEKISGVLDTWKNEWTRMKLITDDEDNANRRIVEERSFEKRQAAILRRNPTAKRSELQEFEVKGLRKAKEEHPEVTRARQDRPRASSRLLLLRIRLYEVDWPPPTRRHSVWSPPGAT